MLPDKNALGAFLLDQRPWNSSVALPEEIILVSSQYPSLNFFYCGPFSCLNCSKSVRVVTRLVRMSVIHGSALWKVLQSVDSTYVTSITKLRCFTNFSDCRSFRIPLARCPCSSEVPALCFSRAHNYCPVSAGQPPCVLHSTVINNMFAVSFTSLCCFLE